MFNSISMTRLAASMAVAAGVAPPQHADAPIPQVEQLVNHRLGGRADRILIYNPDAVAMWQVQKYTEDFTPVMARTELTVPMSTVMPAVTPVCFGTMYTGALPEVHGIQSYSKPVITLDSLFDAFARAGKKVALVAVADSSMAIIFGGRDIDYFLLPYDREVLDKAKELIAGDQYDVVIAYNQEFDDVMHDTGPESPASMEALHRHIAAFTELTDAVKAHWQDHDALVCWASDHGIHLTADGVGDHGEYIEEDINIFHFYGAYPRTKD